LRARARSRPNSGAPGRALLGSACHGCLFIAECSCERANQYLDRALVVPTMGIADADNWPSFRRRLGVDSASTL
jgi:hypothetical protein